MNQIVCVWLCGCVAVCVCVRLCVPHVSPSFDLRDGGGVRLRLRVTPVPCRFHVLVTATMSGGNPVYTGVPRAETLDLQSPEVLVSPSNSSGDAPPEDEALEAEEAGLVAVAYREPPTGVRPAGRRKCLLAVALFAVVASVMVASTVLPLAKDHGKSPSSSTPEGEVCHPHLACCPAGLRRRIPCIRHSSPTLARGH